MDRVSVLFRKISFFLIGVISLCGCACAGVVQSPSHIALASLPFYEEKGFEEGGGAEKGLEAREEKEIVGFYRMTLADDLMHRLVDMRLWEKRSFFHHGWCSFKRKEWDQAIGWFRTAIKEYPYLTEYSMFFMASSLENKGDFAGALAQLSELTDTSPDSPLIPRAYLKLADLRFCLGDYKKAIDLYEKVVESIPGQRPYIRYQMAVACAKIEKWDAAIDNYKSLIVMDPGSLYQESAKEYFNALKIKGLTLSREQVFQRAEILYKRREYDSAEKEYRSLLKGDKGFLKRPQVLYRLAQCYKNTGRKELAIETIKGSIPFLHDKDDIAKARIFWARILWNDGVQAGAQEQLNAVIKKDPSNAEALYILGRIEEERKDIDKAVSIYRKITKNSSEGEYYFQALWKIGWVLYAGGDYAGAVSHFDRYYKGLEKDLSHEFLYWRGRAEEGMGMPQKAKETFNALLGDTTYWSYYSALAEKRLGIVRNRWESAIDNIRHKIDLTMFKGREKELIDRIWELWLLGLRDEARQEIKAITNGSAIASPDMLLYLALLAHLNEEHELGIRIGIEYNRHLKTRGDATGTGGDLLIYPVGFFPLVTKRAKERDLDPFLVFSIIRQESLFDPFALSVASAHGLMQMIPPTAKVIARDLDMELPANMTSLFDPNLNLTFGCFFLKGLLERFDNNLVFSLASYNAGPHVVQKWQDRFPGMDEEEFIESIPYTETREYVKRVLKNYWIYKRIYSSSRVL